MRSIDQWLGSEETDQAFSHCIHCRLPLLEIDAPWLVNKDFQRDECLLEYAICQPCRDEVADRISEESKAAVRSFLEQSVDWDARLADFMSAADTTERFSTCIACRRPREFLAGYAISAFYDSGGHLVIGPLPLLICRTCIGEMTDSLSKPSREVWRSFVDEHFTDLSDGNSFPGLL